MANAAVAVSAPGKVLLAGGYLVLDREYLIKWAIATLVIGLCLERIAQRKLVMA